MHTHARTLRHTQTHNAALKRMKDLSRETPMASSQEDPITACALIKVVPLSALQPLIAISSPQRFPTQAAQIWLYNWTPEKPHNGVNSVYVRDKTNLLLLDARFPTWLVGTHIGACYASNVRCDRQIVIHTLCVCAPCKVADLIKWWHCSHRIILHYYYSETL